MIINTSIFLIAKRGLFMLFVLAFFMSLVHLSVPVSATATYAVELPTINGEVLPAGTVVAAADGANTVQSARRGEGRHVLGVVASLTENTLAANNVGIVSSGIVSVLVSDIGGTIKSGDRIAISPIQGVGMKTETTGWIIGIAQTDFASSPRQAVQEQIVDVEGNQTTVSIKEIPLLLSVNYHDSARSQDDLLRPVQDALESAVGRPVPIARTLLALLIFGVAIILLVTLVYSAIKNSMVSIGRNPLAKTEIASSLLRVFVFASVVIVFTLAIIYLIIK